MIQFKRVQFKAQFVFHGVVVREVDGATYDTAAASVTFLINGKPCTKPWVDVEFAEPRDWGVRETSPAVNVPAAPAKPARRIVK